MLILISPAKTLDFDTPATTSTATQPELLARSKRLIKQLRDYSPQQIARLMKLSDKLASLNAARFGQWAPPFTADNAKQALLAFKGDVYTGLDADRLSEQELAFAQQHLRILSGLYGVLRPLDLMQAYRLEMGTPLANPQGKDLYAFWGDTLTKVVNRTLHEQQSDTLVNLASQEYFKSIQPKRLKARLITPVFKDQKHGQYKVISFYAKKARGLMTRFAIVNRITDAEKLQAFDSDGYYFAPAASSDNEWVFLRDHAE